MGIIAWLKKKGVERRKKDYAHRLAEIQAGLQRLKTRDPRIRYALESQRARIRELRKQLHRVKSLEELRSWQSLFTMCLPSFKALTVTAPPQTGKGSAKKRVRKQHRQ